VNLKECSASVGLLSQQRAPAFIASKLTHLYTHDNAASVTWSGGGGTTAAPAAHARSNLYSKSNLQRVTRKKQRVTRHLQSKLSLLLAIE
jgi:hypothetical protein